MNIHVTKRDGSKELFNADKINKSIERACFGLEDPISKVVQIATETKLMLYDGITTEELDYATINAALQNIQEDIVYDKIATRLLLKTVYERIFGNYDGDNPYGGPVFPDARTRWQNPSRRSARSRPSFPQ